MIRWTQALVLLTVLGAMPVRGQELLDRVVATIGGYPLTLTDVIFARGVGIIASDTTTETDAVGQLVDRRLLAIELSRLPPREPATQAVDAEAARMRQRAGGELVALLRSTGYDDASVRESARETLRIEAYLAQRFGAGAGPSSPEVRQLLSDLRVRARVLVVDDVR